MQGYPRKPRRRIWVQRAVVEAEQLEMQVKAARQRRLSREQEAIADGITELIDAARRAAFREDPKPRWWTNWWRGTLVETAYLNLHSARAQIVNLYDEFELQAEVPPAIARAQATLHRDDPRRTGAAQVLKADPFDPDLARPVLRRLISDSYEKSDLEHAQLRSFRNIVAIAAFLMLALVVATVLVIARYPNWLPLCFTGSGTPPSQVCPTSTGSTGPRGADIIMVAILGALGGTLTSAVSIRNLKGTSTPYDVPVALGFLKVPLGAFTAILAIVAIRGGFVPGLTDLDSQEQILAYALVFGFAQQALSRLLDQRAQALLEGMPGGTSVEPTPDTTPVTPPAAVPLEPEKAPEDTAAAPTEEVTAEPDESEVPLEPDTGEEAAADVAPAGALPEDDDVMADFEEPEEPGESEPEGPDLDLPDPEEAEYHEDGGAEAPEGEPGVDGVVYPTGDEVPEVTR
jgi:hypothetical protein